MRIPEGCLACTVFLGRLIETGSQSVPKYAGTGFLVFIPSSIDGTNHVYLVTARHVAAQLSLGNWFLRVNSKTGDCIEAEGTKEAVWWTHPTEKETVDVAVMPFTIPAGAEFSCLPEKTFLDDAVVHKYGVGAGDEVHITGLFTRAPGRLRNLPIVRTGNISLIPFSGEWVQ